MSTVARNPAQSLSDFGSIFMDCIDFDYQWQLVWFWNAPWEICPCWGSMTGLAQDPLSCFFDCGWEKAFMSNQTCWSWNWVSKKQVEYLRNIWCFGLISRKEVLVSNMMSFNYVWHANKENFSICLFNFGCICRKMSALNDWDNNFIDIYISYFLFIVKHFTAALYCSIFYFFLHLSFLYNENKVF